MAPDSRRALLLQIIYDANRVIRHAEAALLSGDTAEPTRLCAWLYRLACEVAMLRGWPRPRVDRRIEAEALCVSADQAAQWRAIEAARGWVRWFVGRR
jgi:hypothetical protein